MGLMSIDPTDMGVPGRGIGAGFRESPGGPIPGGIRGLDDGLGNTEVMRRFMQALFDDEAIAAQAAEIGGAILAARSLRLTEIAAKMRGKAHAAYKRIHRFLRRVDPRQVLWRLFQEPAEFVLADPTEVERPQARKTADVGIPKDQKTKGFWLLLLATPFRGRAIPCGFITSSSKTIAESGDSRNLNHFRAFERLKNRLGERPLVLDREFSYLELLLHLVAARIHFVIRLNLGSHPPKFLDAEGRGVVRSVSPGQKAIYRRVWYKGKGPVNLIGVWKKGYAEPLGGMSDLEPEKALQTYLRRMKIDETFRDLKSRLGLERQMNKSWEYMEKMVALFLLVYTVGVLLLYGKPVPDPKAPPGPSVLSTHRLGDPPSQPGGKWKRYSDLFVLLKQKWSLSTREWQAIVGVALASFLAIVHPLVPTHV